MTIADLAGMDLGEFIAPYTANDVILYALAVGAHAEETHLVYERDLHVLPTFPLTLGLWAVRAAGASGAYDATRTLHVGQKLEVLTPLAPCGELRMRGSIESVWDKGSAAVLDVVVQAPEFIATYTIFVPGAGGFGGDRGPKAADVGDDRSPDILSACDTHPDQAALYRLTGDPHPVHIDPDAAAAVGFDRPILHGLCTLGCVSLEIARRTQHRPDALRSLTARFSSPVFPGDRLDIEVWTGPQINYSARVDGTGTVISGTLAYAP